jgi:glycosyltransferase involved in cell wall biosynthesis
VLSVIVPAYNCERYLSAALASAKTQLADDWDVWVIDDGSTDHTLDIARAFAAEDPRFKVLTQPNSGGPAQPRNRAIALSTSAFLAFLDPDDYYLPGKLARQLQLMQVHPEVDLVFSDSIIVDEDGVATGQRYLQRVNYLPRAAPHLERVGQDAYVTRPSYYGFAATDVAGPTTSNVVLRRAALERYAEWFVEDLIVGEDLDLWFRMLGDG